jgi:hypothetical protein
MRRRLVIFGGVAVLSTAAIALFLWQDGGGNPQVKLEDGSVLVLRKVAYVRNHRMSAGTWWQRLAGSFVPATLAQKWKIPVGVCTNEHRF